MRRLNKDKSGAAVHHSISFVQSLQYCGHFKVCGTNKLRGVPVVAVSILKKNEMNLIDKPRSPFLEMISAMHCLLVSPSD